MPRQTDPLPTIAVQVPPGLRDALGLIARARVMLEGVDKAMLPAESIYAVTSQCPSYLRCAEDQLAGVVWRLSR